jgi:hypothetical protein
MSQTNPIHIITLFKIHFNNKSSLFFIDLPPSCFLTKLLYPFLDFHMRRVPPSPPSHPPWFYNFNSQNTSSAWTSSVQFLLETLYNYLNVLELIVLLLLYFYLSIHSPLFDLWIFFSLLIFYTVGRTPWTGDQPVARTLSAQLQNKRTQTSMAQVFERAKTVHALDRAATEIGFIFFYYYLFNCNWVVARWQ